MLQQTWASSSRPLKPSESLPGGCTALSSLAMAAFPLQDGYFKYLRAVYRHIHTYTRAVWGVPSHFLGRKEAFVAGVPDKAGPKPGVPLRQTARRSHTAPPPPSPALRLHRSKANHRRGGRPFQTAFSGSIKRTLSGRRRLRPVLWPEGPGARGLLRGLLRVVIHYSSNPACPSRPTTPGAGDHLAGPSGRMQSSAKSWEGQRHSIG